MDHQWWCGPRKSAHRCAADGQLLEPVGSVPVAAQFFDFNQSLISLWFVAVHDARASIGDAWLGTEFGWIYKARSSVTVRSVMVLHIIRVLQQSAFGQ